MNNVIAVVISLLVATSVFAQTPINLQPGSIAGHAVNKLTGDLLPGVRIRLIATKMNMNREEEPTTSSQADGNFRFDSVAPGTYIVIGEKTGFAGNGRGDIPAVVDLAPGGSVNDVQVQLLPDGSIIGKVSDENGAPMPGFAVQAIAITPAGRGTTRSRTAGHATTDAAGSFTISNLRAGNYFVVAMADPKSAPDKNGYEVVNTFYPRALSKEEAMPVPVNPGQPSSANIALRTALTHHIEGKLAALPDGATIKSVRLELNPSLEGTVSIAPDLTFDIAKVLPGSYTLRLMGPTSKRGYGRHLLAMQQVEVGSSDVTGLVLAIVPPVTLTGSVTLDPSARVSLNAMRLVAAPLEEPGRGPYASAKINDDGTFTLQNLDPAPYLIDLEVAQAGLYVSSLTLDGRDILHEAVDLAQVSSGQIAATVKAGTGEIDGTVQDSGTACVIAVVPLQVAPNGLNVRFAYPRQGNSFVAANLAPGDYMLYQTPRGDMSLWINPAFLSEIKNFGTSVHLDENGRQHIQLTPADPSPLQEAALRLGLNYP